MAVDREPADRPVPADGSGPTALSEHIDRNDRGSWQRWVFPGIWLFYLTQTASGVARYSHGAAAVLGYLILIAFGAVYLVALAYNGIAEPRQYAVGVSALGLMFVVESFLAHEDATAMLVYIGVVCISGLGRWGWPALGALTVLAVFGPPLVPSWHAPAQWDMAFTMGAVGLAMFGFFAIMRSNRELSAARSEVARLAAENERSRIARDLHDLLGHSLTTITVKAALARRLVDRDPQRAAQEIGEVEELTRSTLTDVRAAVAGYRDITLSGELSTAHEVLQAAGIEAHTPRAIDIVPAEHRELFAWVVREGVTNVLRHSRAQVCTISVGANWLEIVDDGLGGNDTVATGLRGLRERVDAAGGTVRAGGGVLGGWTVRVDLPAVNRGRGGPSRAVDPAQPVAAGSPVATASEPGGSVVAASEPGGSVVAASEPGASVVAVSGPDGSVVAASEPGRSVAASEPVPDEVVRSSVAQPTR